VYDRAECSNTYQFERASRKKNETLLKREMSSQVENERSLLGNNIPRDALQLPECVIRRRLLKWFLLGECGSPIPRRIFQRLLIQFCDHLGEMISKDRQ